MRHLRTCASMNGIQQLHVAHSAPSVFHARNRSRLRSKRSSKELFSENFLATGDLFEQNTYRVMALGCLKKKEEDEQILIFDRFKLVNLEYVLDTIAATVYWGSLHVYKLF